MKGSRMWATWFFPLLLIGYVLFPASLADTPKKGNGDHGAAQGKPDEHHGPEDVVKSVKSVLGDEKLKPAEQVAKIQELTAPHEDHGNPIFPWALDLGIWTLLVFLLLLVILGRYAWPPMLAGLRKREESIRAAVEEARLARAETERVRAEFQEEMRQNHAKIARMMEEARRDAEYLKEDMVTKATAEIQNERQRLRREIDTARDQALQQIWEQAAKLATVVSARAIRKTLSEEDQRRLVEVALDEVREARERGGDTMRQFGIDYQRQGGGNN